MSYDWKADAGGIMWSLRNRYATSDVEGRLLRLTAYIERLEGFCSPLELALARAPDAEGG